MNWIDGSILPVAWARRLERYLLALGIVAGVTLVRSLADPYLGGQLPYMFYVATIVIVTRLCGMDAGALATFVAAFTANYFFVHPRHQLLPHHDDWLAMSTFSSVAFAVIWFVGRSLRAERTVRELHAQTVERARELEASQVALQHANCVKDQFLATLSHELRTPLNAVLGWTDMLRRRRLQPDEATRAIESTYRNAQVLAEMINDVLDVSRIVSGKLKLDREPVDIATVLENTIDSVRPSAEAKRIALTPQFEPAGHWLHGDSTRLQQVFSNLLSNAIKFTPSGGTVRVTMAAVDGRIEVRIADSGIGIPPEFLPHVFERFRQHDGSSTRRFGGLGLGLAIVRHLVALHGGTVRAESPGRGKGAIFTVALPTEMWEERRIARRSGQREGGRQPSYATRQVAAVNPRHTSGHTLRGSRVLVIDDDEDARQVVTAVLRDHGAVVASAAGAAQAFETLPVFRPTVLLVDLAMPDVDGFMLIERLRALEDLDQSSVPAIALTAYAREEDRLRVLSSGFQLHMPKPADPDRLVSAIAYVQAEPRAAV